MHGVGDDGDWRTPKNGLKAPPLKCKKRGEERKKWKRFLIGFWTYEKRPPFGSEEGPSKPINLLHVWLFQSTFREFFMNS